jgi:hypothetical protein
MSPHAATASRSTGSARRGSIGSRLGHGLAALVSVALLVLVNGTPGWRALPFLTADTTRVLPLVNLLLVVAVLVNALNAVARRRWLRAGGAFVSSTVAVMMLSRLWDTFPFAFHDAAVDWAAITHAVLGLAISACVLSMVVQTVVLVRIVVADGTEARYAGPRP